MDKKDLATWFESLSKAEKEVVLEAVKSRGFALNMLQRN